jgi:hypothetical protein
VVANRWYFRPGRRFSLELRRELNFRVAATVALDCQAEIHNRSFLKRVKGDCRQQAVESLLAIQPGTAGDGPCTGSPAGLFDLYSPHVRGADRYARRSLVGDRSGVPARVHGERAR